MFYKDDNLPGAFLEKMGKLLGRELDSFYNTYSDQPKHALRINPLKISRQEWERIQPFSLRPVPWIRDGYFYDPAESPSRHPFYHEGLFYIQEASAMTPASRLPISPGDRVLDLCAAPGGKATALGAALKGRGLLFANDINQARAKALLRNIELFGISNAFVGNEPPHRLAQYFPEYFDKIMVDAPCSGEGMFRKNPAVREAWLEKGPDYFSALQREIILHGADMLRPGGLMFYSTCTFSPEENEAVITHLLRERADMEVCPMEDYDGFAPGITEFDGETYDESCRLCRRIWPHRMEGEGHFLALLRKREKGFARENVPDDRAWHGHSGSVRIPEDSPYRGYPWWNQVRGINQEQRTSLEEFFTLVKMDFDPARVDIRKGSVYYLPEEQPSLKGLKFLRNGLFLGELKKKRFEPSQPFALSLKKEEFSRIIDLKQDDERLKRYLRGETINVDEKSQGKSHWYLLLAEGHPLGFGKLTGNVLKNKLPAGWRINR